MSHIVEVPKGKTVILPVSLAFNVSGDLAKFSCHIRTTKEPTAPILATWEISFATNGKDGELILKLPYTVTETLPGSGGWMDLKRDSLSVFRGEQLYVQFI